MDAGPESSVRLESQNAIGDAGTWNRSVSDFLCWLFVRSKHLPKTDAGSALYVAESVNFARKFVGFDWI